MCSFCAINMDEFGIVAGGLDGDRAQFFVNVDFFINHSSIF
jgi:hypothetical protein